MPASQADVLAKLGSFLNRPLTDDTQAPQHVAIVTEFVRAYTRGSGFDINGNANDDLAAVIVTATARLLASLSLMPRREVGPMALVFTPFRGFTVAEMIVLNRYRQRTA